MKYIKDTLVEFEQPAIAEVPRELLLKQRTRLQAFHYELYDSFTRGGHYVVRYVFYTLRRAVRQTRTQMMRQLGEITPGMNAAPPVTADELEETARRKGLVVYHYASQPAQENTGKALNPNLPEPLAVFTDTPGTPEAERLEGLKKAAFYAFRKDALLLVESIGSLMGNPLFYNILEEYQIPVFSLDFPWLCRKNLRLMQAMALYNRLNTGN